MSARRRLGAHLKAILSAADPASTFEAARALGERGPDVLAPLLECLREQSTGAREAPVWGLASALQWVMQGYLEAVAGKRAVLSEYPLTGTVEGLSQALARLGPGMESPAIKIATILGEELPRATGEFLASELTLPLRARLLERCRLGLEGALGGGPAAVIGGLTGLSQLAAYVGPAMIRPALERVRKDATDARIVEIASWALTMIDEDTA